MKRKRFAEEQIAFCLRQHEAYPRVADLPVLWCKRGTASERAAVIVAGVSISLHLARADWEEHPVSD